jgi:hypothetical protein
MAQNDSVNRLQELGFEIISITKDVLVCKLDLKDPKSDNGRWIDLSINEEVDRMYKYNREGQMTQMNSMIDLQGNLRENQTTGRGERDTFTFSSLDCSVFFRLTC